MMCIFAVTCSNRSGATKRSGSFEPHDWRNAMRRQPIVTMVLQDNCSAAKPGEHRRYGEHDEETRSSDGFRGLGRKPRWWLEPCRAAMSAAVRERHWRNIGIDDLSNGHRGYLFDKLPCNGESSCRGREVGGWQGCRP